MPRGGERAGKPTGTYSNRSDMQTGPRTAGQTTPQYGSGSRSAQVEAVPDAQDPTMVPPPPGSLPSLTGPSDRPGEPLTAGLSLGEGPGPESLTPTPSTNPDLYMMRALYAKFPHEDLRRLIERAERDI